MHSIDNVLKNQCVQVSIKLHGQGGRSVLPPLSDSFPSLRLYKEKYSSETQFSEYLNFYLQRIFLSYVNSHLTSLSSKFISLHHLRRSFFLSASKRTEDEIGWMENERFSADVKEDLKKDEPERMDRN